MAQVKILVPEQTFTPLVHEAMIMDMSVRGMKLRTWEIDQAAYKMLLSSTRLIRVTFTPPDPSSLILYSAKFTGWILTILATPRSLHTAFISRNSRRKIKR